MPAEDSLDQQIIEKLNSLPRVTLSAEAKEAQLGVIMSTIASGAVVIAFVPLYQLLFSRIKDVFSKYFFFSTLIVSLVILAILSYLVYPQTGPKPPFNEKPVLTQQPQKKMKAKTERQTDQKQLAEAEREPTEEPEPGRVLAHSQEDKTAKKSSSSTSTRAVEPDPSSPEVHGQPDPSGDQPSPPPVDPAQQEPKCTLRIISEPPFVVGHAIRFAADCSDEDGEVVRVVWNFGDGGSLELGPEIQLVDHIYTVAGSYTVTLTVFDNDGNSAKATKNVTIVVQNQPPVARFSDNAPKKVGQPVRFNNKSYDPDGLIVEVRWEFGDGSTSSEENPTHVYEKAKDDYTVSLKVTDNQGDTAYLEENITIRDDPAHGSCP